MVKRTKSVDVDGPAKAVPEEADLGGADLGGDGAASPEQVGCEQSAIGDLDHVLARITGRPDQAPTGPAEASDANFAGAFTEDAQGDGIDRPGAASGSAAEPPATVAAGSEERPEPTIDSEPDAPSQTVNKSAESEISSAGVAAFWDEVPAQADADQKPDAGLPEGGNATPAAPPTTIENAPEIGEQAEPPPAEEADQDGVEDRTPAVEPSGPWPEQWGAPSQSNALRVLGDLLSRVEGRGESASSSRSADTEREPAEPAAGRLGRWDRRVSQRPAKTLAEPRSGAGIQLNDVTVEEGSPGEQRSGVAPVNKRYGAGLQTIGRRWRSLLNGLAVRLSRSRRADGKARAGRPDRALRDPATNPTGTSRRKSLALKTKHDRGFASGRRHSRPMAPPPDVPLRPVLEPDARAAEPPEQAPELSSLMAAQPEFQRAFGAKNVRNKVSARHQGVSAGSAFARMQPLPVVAASLGLVAVLAGVYAIYGTQIGEPPATVVADVVATVPVAPATTSAPANRPTKPPTDESGWTIGREVPVVVTSPAVADSFQKRVETDGASPTIQIHPTIAIPANAAPGSQASDAALDADARKALKLLLDFNVREAEALVASVLARNPQHLGGLISRGRVNLLRSDFVAAESAFRQALGGNPLSGVARLGLAEAFLGQRRTAEALGILNAVVAAAPDVVAAYDLRARGFAQSGDLKSMKSDCQTLAARASAEFVGQWCEGLGFKDAGAKAAAVTALNAAVAGGSAAFLHHRQSYLKFRGHYTGEVDGEFGPATRQAIAACVEDPNC